MFEFDHFGACDYCGRTANSGGWLLNGKAFSICSGRFCQRQHDELLDALEAEFLETAGDIEFQLAA